MTIVLYGATGHEGRQVAEELRRRGIGHVLSGRDPEKLAQVGEEAGTPTRAAALDDDRALRDLLEDAALLRAAIAARTHYVDSTGEQAFIRMVFERHSRTAERCGPAPGGVFRAGFDFPEPIGRQSMARFAPTPLAPVFPYLLPGLALRTPLRGLEAAAPPAPRAAGWCAVPTSTGSRR